MVHLRIVAPQDRAQRAVDLLCEIPSVVNVIHLPNAAKRPDGDVILCDVAREDASVVISDLKELEIHHYGSIALEVIDTELSDYATDAEKHAKGVPGDAVVWEEVESRTSEQIEIGGGFLLFMVLAALIAASGIFLNSAILIVGAMVVGPEFGPLAGFCVALVQRRRELAARSAVALVVGFPLAITTVWIATLVFRAIGVTPEEFSGPHNTIANIISEPDFFTVFVALCAGAAGMLSLSTAKSGALIGVLISVTTIPAAANIGVAFAYQDWSSWRGSMLQLALNLLSIVVAGTTVLYIQRQLYRRRRIAHLREPGRQVAGLPIGRSMRRDPGFTPAPTEHHDPLKR